MATCSCRLTRGPTSLREARKWKLGEADTGRRQDRDLGPADSRAAQHPPQPQAEEAQSDVTPPSRVGLLWLWGERSGKSEDRERGWNPSTGTHSGWGQGRPATFLPGPGPGDDPTHQLDPPTPAGWPLQQAHLSQIAEHSSHSLWFPRHLETSDSLSLKTTICQERGAGQASEDTPRGSRTMCSLGEGRVNT